MFLLNKNILLLLLSLAFFLGIIVISYSNWIGIGVIVFFLLMIYTIKQEYRQLTSIFIAFLVSYLVYQLINSYIENYNMSKEINVLLNRVLLLIIVAGLGLVQFFRKKKISFFNRKPNFNRSIVMPFHSIKLSYFMLISLIISGISFLPFIIQQELSNIKSLIIFCLLFSIINATLEELIWRGLMLASLKDYVSIISRVMITSIGFGLLHLAVGIPLIISLLFSFGGAFYAFVVIQTESIYPAIIFHFIVNIGMVLSGLIL
ncbi:CPBP family intramembrane metalloprotease [Bacillus sp. A301a_S52]|nr:CPBP family intramembrane metalloprotease [Bacillus sp. A301a_S52]